MGSQSRRKKKSARKRPRFIEEERNAKRRIGNDDQQQADHEGQANIMDTQIQGGICDGFGQEGASSNNSNLPRYIPTNLPSPLHSRIDVGEKIADRTIRYHTNKMYHEYFSPKSLIAQAQLLTCLLRRKEMGPVLSFLGVNQDDNIKVSDTVVNNVRSSYDLIGSKTRTKDHRAARRSIVTAIVSKMTSNKRLVTATSKALNISRRTLTRRIATREQLEIINPNQSWAIVCRLPRNDKVSNEWHTKVVNFWAENSRVSSNRRDVLTHRISRGVREEHQKHLLDISRTELFHKFQDAHRDITIGQRTFEAMKPWYIRPNKVRDTCCCRYHVEFSYYYEAFRNYRLQFQPTNEAPQMHVTDFIKNLLCERGEGDIFYNMKCVKNECDNCLNLKKWKDYVHDSSNDMIRRKMFKYVAFSLSHGGESKRIDLVEEEVPIKEFINTFKTKQIYQYVQHSHMARWKDLQFRASRDTFPIGVVLSVIDFAENYAFSPQREIQSQYYHSEQVSILVHVSYRHAEEHIDGRQSTPEHRIVIKEAHFYISDDSEHDTLFVQHSFNIFLDSLIKDRGVNFKEHWVWSDGCAGQFKSARSFFWLCRLHHSIKIRHTWSFFESGHGKGEHDGARACIKRALRRYQMRFDADMMQDAKSVVDWCTHNLCHEHDDRSDKFVRRFFWYITDVDREHAYTCKTIPGTRSLHSIRSTDHTDWVLHIREHACYCAYCIGDELQETCANIQQGFVEEWRQTILEPLDRVGPTQVHIPHEDIDEGPQFSSDYDIISGLVREGDVFAVIAPPDNVESVEYYLLRCTSIKCKLLESLIDSDGQDFERGSVVLKGKYFKQVEKIRNAYIFEEYEPHNIVMQYSHHVIATHLPLQLIKRRGGRRQRWKLGLDDHERSLDVLSLRADPDPHI